MNTSRSKAAMSNSQGDDPIAFYFINFYFAKLLGCKGWVSGDYGATATAKVEI
jgi:hypothetical protein